VLHEVTVCSSKALAVCRSSPCSSPRRSAPDQTYRFVSKNVRLHGVETGSRKMFEEMNAFISAQGLRPVIDRVVPFTTFPDALRHLESGAHFGKSVVGF
jgi:NADPH:quinone reductase-like Zn-dependent oxidoreductase